MIYKKKFRFRVKFKTILRLRENIQNRKKLLNFRKKKWETLIKRYTKKLKWYRKFKPQDQSQYLVVKYPSKGTAYNKRYRNTLSAVKKFSFLYGNLHRKLIKKHLRSIVQNNSKKFNLNAQFLELFERRLDTVLYRAKFVSSIRTARQLISHKKVRVNNQVVTSKSYLLKQGDLVSINVNSIYLVRLNIRQINVWPIPPKHLFINYKTMEIIFGNFKNTNIFNLFDFNLDLEKVLLNYNRQ